MRNETLNHALQSLAHPLSLLMIGVLILNDHILKHTMPSWWTGKLSDVAGLAFAPLLVAVFLALIIPGRIPQQKSVVFWSAFLFVGLVFTLVKTAPSFNQSFLDALYHLTGNHHQIILDPTDLLALPALYVAYWIWYKSPKFQPSRVMIIAGLTLASLGTVATSVLELHGATCLQSAEGRIQVLVDDYRAFSAYGTYRSDNGGLTWQKEPFTATLDWSTSQQRCSRKNYTSYSSYYPQISNWKYVSPTDSQHIFKFSYTTIEESFDGGNTWQVIYEFEDQLSKQRREHLQTLFGDSPYTSHGPQDAILDPETGNLIVAMGYHGILVRETSGKWEWVGVEEYDANEMILEDEYQQDLRRDTMRYHVGFISIMIFILTMNIVPQSPTMLSSKNLLYNLFAAGAFFLAFWIVSFNTLFLEYFNLFYALLSTSCLFVILVSLGIVSLVVFAWQNELYRLVVYFYTALLAIFPTAGFFLPFYLWYSGTLSSLGFAIVLAFASAIFVIFIVRHIFQRHVQPIESKK